MGSQKELWIKELQKQSSDIIAVRDTLDSAHDQLLAIQQYLKHVKGTHSFIKEIENIKESIFKLSQRISLL